MNRKLLNVLCFQGFRQTDSTHQIPASDTSSTTFPSWWHTIKNPKTNQYQYKGLSDTLYYVNQLMFDYETKKNKKFDGILGFSQGGVLCGIILALINNQDYAYKQLKLDPNRFNIDLLKRHISFSWINAGFIARDESMLPLFLQMKNDEPGVNKIEIQSMVVIGKTDEIVEHRVSKHLEYIISPDCLTLVEHDGAHCIPVDDNSIQRYKEFLTTV